VNSTPYRKLALATRRENQTAPATYVTPESQAWEHPGPTHLYVPEAVTKLRAVRSKRTGLFPFRFPDTAHRAFTCLRYSAETLSTVPVFVLLVEISRTRQLNSPAQAKLERGTRKRGVTGFFRMGHPGGCRPMHALDARSLHSTNHRFAMICSGRDDTHLSRDI